MNKQLVSIALLVAATGAFAQEQTSDAWMQSAVSQKSRAEVQAAAAQAKANGDMKVFRTGYIESSKSTLTRAQVQADLQRARANGQFAAINAEQSPLSNTPAATSFAEGAGQKDTQGAQ